ncbi:MAG: hypothetical protein KFH87_02465 [Bacteroidetes bacterium]|nr:hypothetical protein [Bacteroidota bacterium]
MTSVEQHKLVKELRDYEAKMSRSELEMFEMFRKRDKDDEDLDNISRKKLKALHEKYVVSSQPKGNPLDALFGKKG